MYQIAICDDEPVFLRMHGKMVAEILTAAKISYQISLFSSAIDLKTSLLENPNRFAILLLDILLDSENGIEVAKFLRSIDNEVNILFITSSPDFSLESHSIYPVNYLLKPLQKERLKEVLLRDYSRNHEQKKIAFPIKGGFSSVSLDSILYIEIINRQVIVHTIDRQIEITCPTLMSVEELLPVEFFLQCHRGFIANMQNVKDITKNNLLLKNGESIPVGRAYYQKVLISFVNFIAQKKR